MSVWLPILMGLLGGGFFGVLFSRSKEPPGVRAVGHLIHAGVFVVFGLILYAITPENGQSIFFLYSSWIVSRIAVIEITALKYN